MSDLSPRSCSRRGTAPLAACTLAALAATSFGQTLTARAAAADTATTKFCAAHLAVTDLVKGLDGPANAVPTAKKMQAAVSGVQAPAPIAPAWTTLTTAINAAAGGKGDALFDEGLFPTLAKIELFAFDNCGHSKLTITTTDGKFVGFPAVAKPGVYSIKNINKGKEAHVISIGRRRAGQTAAFKDILAKGLAMKKAGKDPEALLEGTFEFINGYSSYALPGQQSADTVTLTPGDYLVLDTVTVGTTGTGAGPDPSKTPLHFEQGMYTEFKVR